MKLSPLYKGLITATLLLVVALLYYYLKLSPDSPLAYLPFVLYAGGIAWTLISYAKSENYTGKFGDIFAQGFKCFIVIVLVMTVYSGIFAALHPEYAEKSAAAYKEYLDKEVKDKTPAEKDEIVATHKKYYTAQVVQESIFGYLIPGVVFTLAGAGLLILKKKNQ